MGELDTKKHYAERKPWELEPYFSAHMSAMTGERLHDKGDIAAELAFRDAEIARLREMLEADPLPVPEECVPPMDVIRSWLHGSILRFVYRNGPVTLESAPILIRQLARIYRHRTEWARRRRSVRHAEKGEQWTALVKQRDEARAQLAAAQADNAALRGALTRVTRRCVAQTKAAPLLALAEVGGFAEIYQEADAALATPAPGAPLLDAIRDLEAAATGWHNAECPGIDQGLPLGECCRQSAALAAVRAVLSRAQDTAGISRGGDG